MLWEPLFAVAAASCTFGPRVVHHDLEAIQCNEAAWAPVSNSTRSQTVFFMPTIFIQNHQVSAAFGGS